MPESSGGDHTVTTQPNGASAPSFQHLRQLGSGSQICKCPFGSMRPQGLLMLALAWLPVIQTSLPAPNCDSGTISNCACVNVSHTLLNCLPDQKNLWVYESQLKAASDTKEMTLKCGDGVNATILDDLELVGVGRSASFKMVGCADKTLNQVLSRRCTPVLSRDIGFLKRFWNFISFSYTYTTTTTLRQLDLVGCSDVQKPENLQRVKNLMSVDAIRLFGLEGIESQTTFIKFLYYGTKQFQISTNSTQGYHNNKGLNIDLSDREIRRINQNAFIAEGSQTKFEIEMLNLSDNLMNELPEGLFPNTTFGRLQWLDLSNNNLMELPKNIFRNLTSMGGLSLAGNFLKTLPGTVFTFTPLERLDLSHNLLEVLNSNLLITSYNLETLDISYNKLTSYSLKSANDFRRLQILNLAFNSLTRIEKDWQLGYLNLRDLNVSHNKIGPMVNNSDLQFRNFHYGMFLDLSYNDIEVVDILPATALQPRDDTWQTINLELKGNPLTCDCRATQLKQVLDGALESALFNIPSKELVCKNSDKLLRAMNFRQLNCPLEQEYPGQECGDFNCQCTVNRFHKEVFINCSNRNLTTAPLKVVEFLDPSLTVKLDISRNKIKEIVKDGNWSNYHNIKYLNLSSNRLSKIKQQFLPNNLTFLSLDNNNINQLSKDNIEFIQTLINETNFQLMLAGNPYECNCLSERFHNFLLSPSGSRVLDHNQVKLDCTTGPMQLVNAEEEDFCYASATVLIPTIAVITTLAALIFLILAIYLGNRQRLLVYLYSKKWSRRFFHEEYIDQDKHYDAFISYSHADAEYVEQTLLKGLEKAPDREFRYKVCVHSRDWNVGEGIPSQIFRSVADSRKTIIVLSQSYVESKWSDMEFMAAHKKALQDKIQRVIVIKHGELVAAEEMEEELQNYLKMNTYLDSSDPWFWPKLRYTLPHRRKISAIGEKVFWSALDKV